MTSRPRPPLATHPHTTICAASAAALVIALAAPLAQAASDRYAVPPPSLVESLRLQHTRQWMRVVTDSAEWEVRVRSIDNDGLNGLFGGHGASRKAPKFVAWPMIRRIDLVKSRYRSQQIKWLIQGASIGGVIPTLADNAHSKPTALGILVGGAAGWWLGGINGEHGKQDRAFYVARENPSRDALAAETRAFLEATAARDSTSAAVDSTARRAAPIEMSVTDSLAAAAPPGTPAPGAPPPAPEAAAPPPPRMPPGLLAPGIRSACDAITPKAEVRVFGDFGRFDGRVTKATPDGLAGLVPNRAAQTTDPSMENLAWERIYSVEKRGSNAGKTAIVGGTVLGALGLLIGFAGGVATSVAGTGDSVLGPTMLGAVGGFAAGAAIGGLMGAGSTRWTKVYER